MRAGPTSVIVLVEHDGGALRRSASEVLATAGRWSSGGGVLAVALGPGAEKAARASTRWGACQARWLDEPCAPMRWLRAVAQVAEEVGASRILCADSMLGRDLAPRLAVRLNGYFAPGVLTMDVSEAGLRVKRPVFGGRFLEELSLPGPRPVVMTWRGGGGASVQTAVPSDAVVRPLELRTDSVDRLVRIAGESARKGGALSEADVVVCGGRGVGSREGFELVYALADALGGAAAASRAAVDAGYAPVELQVGQSGKTVSPAFYFALGISGSLQHRAGMRTSRCVVAINSDPAAPILRWADYGVTGDVRVVVPALIEAVKGEA